MTNFTKLHDWNLSPREAVALQKELRHRVLVQPPTREAELVAGASAGEQAALGTQRRIATENTKITKKNTK